MTWMNRTESSIGIPNLGGAFIMKVQTFSGLTVALIFACIVLPTHAQGAAGGLGSAAEGASKQAGQNAAGQMMQNMGSSMMASLAATASPMGAPSVAGASSMPSVPGVPSMPTAPSVPTIPSAPAAPGGSH